MGSAKKKIVKKKHKTSRMWLYISTIMLSALIILPAGFLSDKFDLKDVLSGREDVKNLLTESGTVPADNVSDGDISVSAKQLDVPEQDTTKEPLSADKVKSAFEQYAAAGGLTTKNERDAFNSASSRAQCIETASSQSGPFITLFIPRNIDALDTYFNALTSGSTEMMDGPGYMEQTEIEDGVLYSRITFKGNGYILISVSEQGSDAEALITGVRQILGD